MAKRSIAYVHVGAQHAPREQYRIDVSHELQDVVVGVRDATHAVVRCTSGVVIVVAVEEDTACGRVIAQVLTDDDASVVEVVTLDRVDRADFVD